jgi:hypothetical protein
VMLIDGGLRRRSPASGVHYGEGHHRLGTLLHRERAWPELEKALMSGQWQTAMEEVRSMQGPLSVRSGDAA